MPVHQRQINWSLESTLSWRATLHRFSFVFFMLLAGGLLVLGKTNPPILEASRTRIVDSLAPLLDVATRPMDMAEQFSKRLRNYAQLQNENEKLRAQNAQMVRWQNAVVALDHENKELRNLLHFKAEPGFAYISARVIADTGGPFVRALVVTAGRNDGAREGMAAMTGDGLIGRVIEVSDHSSRVLLLTDLSSRIPVTIAGTGDNAILAGDNTTMPKLLYMPQDAVPPNGARVLTSGHGGIFPPNLPVGTLVNSGHGNYEVMPLASFGRISYLTLIDFNLAGGLTNSIATKLLPKGKTR